MRILCAHSSVEFECTYFPGSLFSREVSHPIFYIPQKKLLTYTPRYFAGELEPTSSYLLFLALLASSELVEFRVPAMRSPFSAGIIAQNIESLTKILIRMNSVYKENYFSKAVITPETRTLQNVPHWIHSWEEQFSEFQSGKIKDYDNRRELALERAIKSPHKKLSHYAFKMADWAAEAYSFPTFKMISPFSGSIVTCSDYWKQIIIKAVKDDSLFSVSKPDLEELIDHCETGQETSHGIYSKSLFTVLYEAKKKLGNLLDLGDRDIAGALRPTIVNPEDTEGNNLLAVAMGASSEKPRRESYSSNFEFLRAKMRYDLAQKYEKSPKNPGSGESE